MIRSIAIFSLIITNWSCSREIDCIDPPIYLSFISFQQNTLDTLVIRKFTKDGNFQNLIDTLQVTSKNGSIINKGDTSHLSLADPNNYPKPGFDWIIFIKATNQTIRISEINKVDKTGKCAAMETDCFCNDEILGVKVNNQTGVLQTYPAYYLFIKQ